MDQPNDSSRRTFLKSATALTAAGLASQQVFAGTGFGKPNAEKLGLRVKPETSTLGPVIVESGDKVYLVYYGCEEDKRGNDLGDGTVMITMEGCKSWRLRTPGDDKTPSHSIDIETLDFCEVYEVMNSDWKLEVPSAEDTSQRRSAPPARTDGLRHFIFTFFGFNPELESGGTHLECLATGIKGELFKNADFDTLRGLMALRDSTPESDNDKTREDERPSSTNTNSTSPNNYRVLN